MIIIGVVAGRNDHENRKVDVEERCVEHEKHNEELEMRKC